MQKRLNIHQKWQKIQIKDFKLFDYFDLGEHEYLIKKGKSDLLYMRNGYTKARNAPKLNQKWT